MQFLFLLYVVFATGMETDDLVMNVSFENNVTSHATTQEIFPEIPEFLSEMPNVIVEKASSAGQTDNDNDSHATTQEIFPEIPEFISEMPNVIVEKASSAGRMDNDNDSLHRNIDDDQMQFEIGLRSGPIEIEKPFGGILYPQISESRDLLSLDGLWSFIVDFPDKDTGLTERWFEKDISKMAGAILMPVPSSYNDITTNASVRDHVGLVWYQRMFLIPASWESQPHRIWLRFGGVHYFARVWINGKQVIEHEIGHLPFQCEITDSVVYGMENKVTVSVDNRLGSDTIPQGILEPIYTQRGPKIIQKYSYGFYNYAGIHLPVYLYSTPKVYLDDIWFKCKFQSNQVFLQYRLSVKGAKEQEEIGTNITVVDKEGKLAGFELRPKVDIKNVSGMIEIVHPKLWWPYLMDSNPGYLYTIEIRVKTKDTGIIDLYRLPFGFRNITWNNESLLINNKPIYIQGISKHEDSEIRGRSLDLPTIVKDHNLLQWLGMNTYRTSHTPEAEESMDLADQMGFMIINEVPSVDTQHFTPNLLMKHKTAVAELINRDKNRACVIMWSLANEPESEKPEAGPYFGSLAAFTREQDDTRPITAVLNRWPTADLAGQWMDIICFNRYNGYFKEPGQLEMIQLAVEEEATHWYQKHNKPVIMSEFGTEVYEGLHGLPEFLWTEEYQSKLFSEHFKAFDTLRENKWFIGEIVYSFTDIKTHESVKRVGSRQRKGLFTRGRQPKSSAFIIRSRNFRLVADLINETILPDDLELYSAPISNTTQLEDNMNIKININF